MNKKLKIFLVIIGIIAVLGVMFFLVDYNKVQKQEKPIFCINVATYRDGGTKEYYGLAYKVIDFHTLEGFDDIKIGTWFMNYNDFNEEMKVYKEKYEEQIRKSQYSFCGTIVQVEETLFFVKPDENEEIKKSSDLIMVEKLKIDTSVKYEIGEKVKITYDGVVMTTYPAQIKAIKYERKLDKNFEILFYDKHPMESYKIYTILDKSETNKYDYTIYGYDGSVNVRIDNKNYSLKEALLENKITMEEIIEKANKDLKGKNITGDMYQDGGSMIYKYNNYTIIKCHTLEGNRDVYIGSRDMTINDLGI